MGTKMIRQWRALFAACSIFTTLFLASCSKAPKRVPAGGSVEVDGKPLEGGILYFNPDTTKGNNASVSCTSPIRNGRFELQTSGIERADSGSGVPPGWYKVSVRVNMPGEKPIFPGQPAVKINHSYLDAEKTPLSIEVVENPPTGAYDLKLTAE